MTDNLCYEFKFRYLKDKLQNVVSLPHEMDQ